jgi:ligand-binding sensor domain-containing protein/signal transduction histidine kinase
MACGRGRQVTVLAVALAVAAPARAERLPFRAFTTLDGLANARVWADARDRRGFLWFATQDGLSRFDGSRFESFGTADGLPDPVCLAVMVDRGGVVWVGTSHGLARFDPDARGAHVRFTASGVGAAGDDQVIALFEDHAGQRWLGSTGGLWRLDARGDTMRVSIGDGEPAVFAIVEDAAGTLWLGTRRGLVRRLPDGRVEHDRFAPADQPDDRTMSLAIDRSGRLWVGHADTGAVALVPPPPGTPLLAPGDTLWDAAARGGPARGADGVVRVPRAPGEIVRYTPDDGLPAHGVRRGICEDSHGVMWFGARPLTRFDGRRFDQLGAAQGVPDDVLGACLEDPEGNLWFHGDAAGVVRLAGHGITSWGPADGLAGERIGGIAQGPDGTIYVSAWLDAHVLHRLDGPRFVAVHPRFPPGVAAWGAWGWGQTDFVDRDGRWWFATGNGVLRYPSVARLEDLETTVPERWGTEDGLPGRDIFRLYQDARGAVWISTLTKTGLARWDRATNRVTTIADAALPTGAALAFAEDRAGALWIAYDDGHLARLPDGQTRGARVFGTADGLPGTSLESLLVDHAGRLWAAGEGGVVRLDDPGATRPGIVQYTAANGLATSSAHAIVEDARGRIYIGTVRGVDRIDPQVGTIDHFTQADGLPGDLVDVAFRDRSGALWLGSHGGLGRLIPDDLPPRAPAAPYVLALSAAGAPQPLALGGERAPDALELGPDEGQLDVTLTVPSYRIGAPLELQERLDGADDDWSEPRVERELHFPHLAPGHYRLRVRAVYPGGAPSAETTLDIVVLSPIWRRWWFLALVAGVVALIAWLAYRRRVEHLLAVERVRTRIATDLHDDLGSSLSRIAILSAVAARRADQGADPGAVIDDIGRSARELVDVASDIVWSTDPRRDDLGSLLVRLRTYAGDVLEGKGIEWSLTAPIEPARVKLGPDERRHLYLIVKEAIHNAARHSNARRVTITVRTRAGGLDAIVEDDGVGIAAGGSPTGNGLANMRARAADAQGTLAIERPTGGGTRVILHLPVRGGA